jgi:hypothetical protein
MSNMSMTKKAISVLDSLLALSDAQLFAKFGAHHETDIGDLIVSSGKLDSADEFANSFVFSEVVDVNQLILNPLPSSTLETTIIEAMSNLEQFSASFNITVENGASLADLQSYQQFLKELMGYNAPLGKINNVADYSKISTTVPVKNDLSDETNVKADGTCLKAA